MWGPYSPLGWDGTKWMVFITDDATRRSKVRRLKQPKDAPAELRQHHRDEERRYDMTIRCENELVYRVWDPNRHVVKRVAFTRVQDGLGLDDPHEGAGINDRDPKGKRQTLLDSEDSEAGTSEAEDRNENDLAPRDRNTSRFFPPKQAMVTTRQAAKQNEEELDDYYVPRWQATLDEYDENGALVNPPSDTGMEGQSPLFSPMDTTNMSEEAETLFPLPETITTRRRRRRNQDSTDDEEDFTKSSRYFQNGANETNRRDQTAEQEGEYPPMSPNNNGSEMDMPDYHHGRSDATYGEPPDINHLIPGRDDHRTSPNQMPVEDSDSSDFFKTMAPRPNSRKAPAKRRRSDSSDSSDFFKTMPTRRDPRQKPSRNQSDMAKCDNDQCDGVANNVGPDGRLCSNCYQRWQR
ncbi:hypothetical protein BST61_g8150 [Cercospora zeina]